MVFKTTGKGSDIFIAGSYQGFSLGVEIQRRQTLLQALKIVLPQIVDDLLLAGLSDSTLAQISAGAASSGLTVLNDSPMQKTFARTINIAADNTARASVQQASVAQCFGKKTSWVENAINGFFLFYAMWKYNHVLDQSLHQAPKMTASAQALKIAMIDSGFDYNDSALRDHVMADSKNQILGFDFISWDPRPSDDNGHGTAAAKLLAQNLKKPFVLIPLKVIGARGETHSSAIYDSFRYAINNKVDAILVPWSAQPQSQGAFDLGLKLAKQAGISVYTVTNHETKKYITRGLGGAHLGLNAQDAAAVEDFAANINCH
jgi:subtilisin family serine protease